MSSSVRHVAVLCHQVSGCGAGVGTDPGPPPPCAGGRCQEHQGVVHQGVQDQGDLPHSQHVQPGRHAEVSHWRVLVPGR